MAIVLANMDVALRERACATDVRLSTAVADHGYWNRRPVTTRAVSSAPAQLTSSSVRGRRSGSHPPAAPSDAPRVNVVFVAGGGAS